MADQHFLAINEIEEALRKALKAWRQQGGTRENLLEFLQLVPARRENFRDSAIPYNLRRVTNTLILEILKELEAESEEDARVLTERFVNDKTQRKVAFTMNLSRDQVSRIQRRAIRKAAEILSGMENAFRQEHIQRMFLRLPGRDYHGTKEHDLGLSRIAAPLTNKDGPNIIALTGIGGIGKTTLAEKVVARVIPTMMYKDVFWHNVEAPAEKNSLATAEQAFQLLIEDLSKQIQLETMAPSRQVQQLGLFFQQDRYLVVIDNLELDNTLDFLIEKLRGLAGPTKILLTSRNHPGTNLQVFSHPLKELDFEDTKDFLHYKQKASGFLELLSEAQVEAIFGVVGGNPLALELVLGLLRDLTLEDVLEDLKQVALSKTEEMYHRIYWRVWHTLSPGAKKVLLALPMATEAGGDSTHLKAITQLEQREFMAAILELSQRSLIMTKGSADQRLYQIHRLTETFLYTNIIDPDDPR